MDFQHYPKALTHPETGDTRICKSEADEAPWRAKGYGEAGKADPEAFIRAQDQGTVEPVYQEWPKWIDGKRVDDPSRPPPPNPNEYPKMIDGRIVHNEDEEIELLEEGSEMAMPAGERAAERDALLAEATKLGMRVDGRWGIERLRAHVRGAGNHHRATA